MRVQRLLAFLGMTALAASAFAQTKIAGTAQCKAESPQPVEVGDKAGHAFAIGKAQCTWSKLALEGVAYKDGVSVSLDEMTGDKATSNGYHVATLANGDKATAHFHGSGTTKDGKFQTASGTWVFTSGTGKFTGIKGKGTYKGKGNPDGTATYDIAGEYSLPKK